MPTLSFEDARGCVLSMVRPRELRVETVGLQQSAGRVLAEPLIADRDYPPTNRSVRDGFAVRAGETPGRFRLIGEVRAGGSPFARAVGSGEAVAIMTGAPMPAGTDAVIMIEHTTHDAETVTTERTLKSGENFNTMGNEATAGQAVIPAGVRIGHPEIALAATYGKTALELYAQPKVAILATGDEIVDVAHTPLAHQIRNSNTWSLVAQVARAGGIPDPLPVAHDTLESTRSLIARGLESDLLLLSGGVSAGKYDLVEQVLAEFGAKFHFDRVLIQPGQPLVFGEAQGTFFFGLPGNPASTMITFELFARAAVEILGGILEPQLHLLYAHLTEDFRHRAGLTRFLPARLDGNRLTPLKWAGSSDVGAMARSNAYLVADPDREFYAAGEPIRVLLK
jgi:molybdopterin molybdotransferase